MKQEDPGATEEEFRKAISEVFEFDQILYGLLERRAIDGKTFVALVHDYLEGSEREMAFEHYQRERGRT